MRHLKKIQAGALQFVLCLGAVITVLLSTFVLLHHTQHVFDQKTTKTVEVIKKAGMGLQYAMAQNFPLNTAVPLFWRDTDGIEVTVSKAYWGIFEQYTVVSRFRKNQFTKMALVGGKLEEDFPALYLKDNNRPLIIAGTSKITGNAFLPRQGIRQGSIGGHFHSFRSPVYGTLYQSSATLPPLAAELTTHLQHLRSKAGEEVGKEVLRLSANLKRAHSFTVPTRYLYGDSVTLSGVVLKGNIVVYATSQIVVDANSTLEDVVLMAPKITITKGFKGTLQAIASEEVRVEDGVVLNYPSALVVDRGKVPNSKNRSVPNITLGKSVILKGIVAYFEASEEQVFFPHLAISATTVIYGEVYCEKNLELKGNVLGKVSTDAFIALEEGSVYQNHLYNGSITSGALPLQYAGLLVKGEKTVAKWLY